MKNEEKERGKINKLKRKRVWYVLQYMCADLFYCNTNSVKFESVCYIYNYKKNALILMRGCSSKLVLFLFQTTGFWGETGHYDEQRCCHVSSYCQRDTPWHLHCVPGMLCTVLLFSKTVAANTHTRRNGKY